MRQREPAAKAICFSQFVNALDLIEYRLLKANESGEIGAKVGVIKLDGRMSGQLYIYIYEDSSMKNQDSSLKK